MKFEKVYNENYRWVLNLIKKRTNYSSEAEEMCNDIFMKVHANLSTFDATKCKTGLVGWIRGFTYNKIIDYYRRTKHISNSGVVSIEDWKDAEGKEIFSIKDTTNIEDDYCNAEILNMAKDVINVLPNPYKLVATMFYLKDLSYDEIVDKTGLSLGTVKGQLSRARIKMQSEFGVI